MTLRSLPADATFRLISTLLQSLARGGKGVKGKYPEESDPQPTPLKISAPDSSVRLPQMLFYEGGKKNPEVCHLFYPYSNAVAGAAE